MKGSENRRSIHEEALKAARAGERRICKFVPARGITSFAADAHMT